MGPGAGHAGASWQPVCRGGSACQAASGVPSQMRRLKTWSASSNIALPSHGDATKAHTSEDRLWRRPLYFSIDPGSVHLQEAAADPPAYSATAAALAAVLCLVRSAGSPGTSCQSAASSAAPVAKLCLPESALQPLRQALVRPDQALATSHMSTSPPSPVLCTSSNPNIHLNCIVSLGVLLKASG